MRRVLEGVTVHAKGRKEVAIDAVGDDVGLLRDSFASDPIHGRLMCAWRSTFLRMEHASESHSREEDQSAAMFDGYSEATGDEHAKSCVRSHTRCINRQLALAGLVLY